MRPPSAPTREPWGFPGISLVCGGTAFLISVSLTSRRRSRLFLPQKRRYHHRPMSDPVRPRRRRTNALSARAPEPPDLLARILDTPHLAQAVPRLHSEVLLRVIHHYGLEACTDLIALATPAQLSAVFDLDLWSSRPGQDEQFDPDRFAVWLEGLAESGVEFAAGKLAAIDAALVIAALAKDMRVFDAAAGVINYSDRDVGGYRLVARRGELSETLVGVLAAL